MVTDDDRKIIFHTVPSGITRKGVYNLLLPGVVVVPDLLLTEIGDFERAGSVVTPQNFGIGGRVGVTFEFHRKEDGWTGGSAGDNDLGTTGKGIGPTYTDRARRIGINFDEFLKEGSLRRALERNKKKSGRDFDIDRYLEKYEAVRNSLAPFLVDEAEFAELCGYVVHVITDVAGAYHVIWGEKQSDHHKYEKGVDDVVTVTSSGDFESEEFEINFDGVLREDIDSYTAVMETATTTYFGRRSILPAEKIEREMEMSNGNVDNWSKKIRKSTRMSMRAATNRAAEALEKLYKMAFEEPLADSTVLDMEIPEVDQE